MQHVLVHLFAIKLTTSSGVSAIQPAIMRVMHYSAYL